MFDPSAGSADWAQLASPIAAIQAVTGMEMIPLVDGVCCAQVAAPTMAAQRLTGRLIRGVYAWPAETALNWLHLADPTAAIQTFAGISTRPPEVFAY